MRTKYTLQECYDKDYAIHCDTKDKADILYVAMNYMGWRLCDGAKYTDNIHAGMYDIHGRNTCYCLHEGMLGDLKFFKENKYKVVWFDDVKMPFKYYYIKNSKCVGCGDIPLPLTYASLDEYECAPILDKEEKRYLEAVLRPFKDSVRYIEVCGLNVNYGYLRIFLMDKYNTNTCDDVLVFPNFKLRTMYCGMKLDKEYTLDELGLFKEGK